MALVTPAVHALLQLTRIELVHRPDLDPNLDLLLPVVRAVANKGSVFVFSTNIGSNFPLISEAGAQWAFRHGGLGMLGAAYSDQLQRAGPVRTRPMSERTALERQLASDLAADLMRYQPAAMFVLNQSASEQGGGGARQFDYLAYFRADSLFVRLFAEYDEAGRIGEYSVLLRHGVSADLQPVHNPDRDGNMTSLRSNKGRVRWNVDLLGVLFLGLGCIAAVGLDFRIRASGSGSVDDLRGRN